MEMYDCPMCGKRHAADSICQEQAAKAIQSVLSSCFEGLLTKYGDTKYLRLKICEYTFGYMGAQYGLHVK
jgi:hypothetical protein